MIVKYFILICIAFRINAQNLEVPVGADYTAIQFKMSRWDIKLQESTNGKVVLTGIKDKSLWNFKKDASGSLLIEERDYENKLFNTGAEIGAKEHLIVKVPLLPVTIVGNELDINIEGMKNNVKFVVIKGSIKGFKNQGEWRVFLNSGDIHLDAQSGPLYLNGSQVRFSMKNSMGDTKINDYGGTVTLEKNTGHNSIFNYQGAIILNQVTGSSQIELSKGSISITQSQGRHDIMSDEAAIDLKATKESDFNVKMKTGKLTYQSSGVTGTWLNLNSKEAEIFLPGGLKPQKVKTEVFYKGRTSGEKTASRLEVKSVNAPIIVR